DDTVKLSATLSVLVTPVALLSGIARFGESEYVFTGLPPLTGLIVKLTLDVCVSVPSVPVIVIVNVPVEAPDVVVHVSVDEPFGPIGFGANPYVTPLIAGDADNVTLFA